MAGEENDYASLKELAKRWESYGFGLDRLIRMAALGKIEVRVLAPEWHEVTFNDKEVVEFPIGYSYAYEPVESVFIWDKLGQGHDSFKSHDVIQTSTRGQIRTARETKFEDLIVTEQEAARFKREHIDLESIQKVLEQNIPSFIQLDPAALFVRAGDELFELTQPQFDCVRVLYEQAEEVRAGNALASHLPQSTVTHLAGLPANVNRLSGVFKSRPDAFKALFEAFKNGRYGLRTEKRKLS